MLSFEQIKSIAGKFERPLVILAGAAGLSSLLLNLDFNLLEANLYDLRMSKGAQVAADPNIVLITLDDKTTQALDEFSPLPLDLHTKFLEGIERMELKALGYLIDFNRVDQVNPDLFKTEWGNRFVEAANRMEARGTPVLIGTPFDVTGEMLPPFPLSSLSHSIAVIHKDGNVFSNDNVTRRALTQLNDKSVFHMELARKLGFIYPSENPRGTFYVPEADAAYFFFRYHGSTAIGHDKFENFPYPRISFLDVLEHKVAPEQLRGKIALVGTLSSDDPSDYAYTPYSKIAFLNPKILVQANILDSIIHNDGIVRAHAWANWLVTFLVTGFVLWWVMNSTPLYGVFATLALVFVLIGLGQALFQVKGVWIRESQPLVGIFIGYYVVVPYRLIREYKKRWDYQRKNELLTQVEELKTNFLNLVTHDLKTPVARIQGLAEVILRQTRGGETPKAAVTDNVRHIIASTEELNGFITSILELSKVETNRLKPQLESRDVNQLIERSIEGFSAQSRAKKIRIAANLDPLFPIRVDGSLISKVINNLIDNALKYSQSNSQITIESREVEVNGENFVEVSVRDQGIGLTEQERENLFTRFYRAKNDATATIAGSGLGLYLTKYFVEAHSGQVAVESTKGLGSCFKILLPMDLKELTTPPLVAHLAEKAATQDAPGLRTNIAQRLSQWISRRNVSRSVKENTHV